MEEGAVKSVSFHFSHQLFQQTWKRFWFVMDSTTLTAYLEEGQDDDIDAVIASYNVNEVNCIKEDG